MFLEYVALGLLFFIVITLYFAVIAIHDVPYEVAKRRQHPHQDAIHVAQVAIYSKHWHELALLRKILLRMKGWQNYIFLEGH